MPDRASITTGSTTNALTFDAASRPTADSVNGAGAYTSDKEGRLRAMPGDRRLVYNALGQLTSVTHSTGAPIASYTYDALDRLRTVSETGNTTRFLYVGLSNAVAQEQNSSTGAVSHATDMAGTDLFDWGISFNTQTYGSDPTGKDGPYNSLNVGHKTFPGQPSHGTDVEPNGVFQNSHWAGQYGDNGANGLDTFRDDTGTINIDWSDYKPLACFGTACPVSAPVASASPTAFQSIAGATGGPRRTPPRTSTVDPSGDSSGTPFALLICVALGGAALVAGLVQRRATRR
jgi:YD repeat-containing protein